MIPHALEIDTNCDSINTRPVFLPLVPFPDSFVDVHGTTVYRLSLTGNMSDTSAVAPTDRFSKFYQIFRATQKPADLAPELNAFQAACVRFPRCFLPSPTECASRFSQAWYESDHAWFICCVAGFVTWISLVELVRIVCLLRSLREHQILYPDFVKPSLFVPLLGLAHLDWWQGVMLRPPTHVDLVVRTITEGVGRTVPGLILTLVYFFTVLQTGLSAAGFVSLGWGMVQIPLLLSLACGAYRQYAQKQQLLELSSGIALTSSASKGLRSTSQRRFEADCGRCHSGTCP